jgi:hypothetical protein
MQMPGYERDIDFLLEGTLRGFFFNPHRPEGLKFTAGPPRPLNVSVTPKKPDTDGGGFHYGLKCRVLTSRSVASGLCTFIAHLIDRKFEPSADNPVELPLVQRGEIKIDETGHIADGFSVPFELYPPALQTVCDEVFRELRTGLERFLKLLRWQQEIDAPHRVFDFEPALYWRIADGHRAKPRRHPVEHDRG